MKITKEFLKILDEHNVPVISMLSKLYPHKDITPIEMLYDRIDTKKLHYERLERRWKYKMQKEYFDWLKDQRNQPDFIKARERYLNQKQKDIYEQYKKETNKAKQSDLENKIKKYEQIKNGTHITQLQIDSAKQYPIESLLGKSINNKYNCISHNDTNPSMHYYKKSNTVYCFTCQYSGDAIDVYMSIHNVSFKESVLSLSTVL